MLDLFGAVAVWLKTLGLPVTNPPTAEVKVAQVQPQPLLSARWWLVPEPRGEASLNQYLQQLTQQGFDPDQQGIWLQSSTAFLSSHGGDRPLPAASITKAATSVVALQTWGHNHQFVTTIAATGPIQKGVLQGDLVVQGSGDPLFVWEEAFVLGQSLNRMGIQRVTGNLIISGKFAMNYETDPGVAGQFLREGLDSRLWSGEAAAQFDTLPGGSPQPRVAIDGGVKVSQSPPPATLLISHRSLPLFELLHYMNMYSNNMMAEMLAENLGGASLLAQKAARAAGVPPTEIQLINGSGLGHENRISPRAACGLFQAIQRLLEPQGLTIADVFPMAGVDRGTVEGRKMPKAAVVKTGTLWDVSALAGAIPTRDYGTVWFAIINRGDNLDGFRRDQDRLLQALIKDWGYASTLPAEFRHQPSQGRLGDPQRNQVVLKPSS